MFNSNFNSYQSPYLNGLGNYQNAPMPMQPQQQVQQAPTQNVSWIPVNGIEGAKNHIVQPSQTAWLMDNNESKFYVKSADSLGVTTLKAYQFNEIDVNSSFKTVLNETQVNLQEYVKRSEIEEIISNKLREIAQSELKEKGK